MRILVEHDVCGDWTPTGGPKVEDEGDELRSGSLSSDGEEGRQVYVFGWLNGDGPCVWRSKAGADLEFTDGDDKPRRAVFSEGLDLIDRLTLDEPFVLRLAQKGRIFNARLRLVP